MSRPLSLLPRLSARPTVPAPPASYEAAYARALAHLEQTEILDREALLRQWREAEDTRALDAEIGEEGAS